VGFALPGALLRPSLIPFLPALRGLCFQAVHTDDVAAAYREAIVRDVRGATRPRPTRSSRRTGS